MQGGNTRRETREGNTRRPIQLELNLREIAVGILDVVLVWEFMDLLGGR